MFKILKSILSNTSCFLDTPAWRRVLTDHPTPPGCTTLEARTIPIYASLPAILRDVRTAIQQSTEANTSSPRLRPYPILSRAHEFRHNLLSLDPLAAGLLNDPTVVTHEPRNSRDTTTPYSTIYNFRDLDAAQALCYHWRLQLIINRMISRLVSVLGLDSADSANTQDAGVASQLLRRDRHVMDLESLHAARNIGMSLPAARRIKPLGSLFVVFSIGIAANALGALGEDEAVCADVASRFEMGLGGFVEGEGGAGEALARESAWMRRVLQELLEPFGGRGVWFQRFYERAIAV